MFIMNCCPRTCPAIGQKNAVLAILISVLRVVSDHCLVGIERESVFVIVRYFSLYLNNKSCFKTLKC